MKPVWIRNLIYGAGLIAAYALASNAVADHVPEGTASKVVAADIAFLQKGLEKEPERRAIPTLVAAAMNIAYYGSDDLQAQALKVAEAINKKDFAGAKTAAAALKPAASKGHGDPLKLAEAVDYELYHAMSAFRAERVGGMNLEKDIRTQAKKVTDLELAELIAGRVASIGAYSKVLPEGRAAANSANKEKWEKLTDDMNNLASDIAKEAGKGSAADMAELAKKFSLLDASCTACHNEYRD